MDSNGFGRKTNLVVPDTELGRTRQTQLGCGVGEAASPRPGDEMKLGGRSQTPGCPWVNS